MKTHAKIQKWGNSLGLRISGTMKTIPHFEENMRVEIDINENGFTVSKAKKRKKSLKEILPYTLEDLMQGLTPYLAHADELEEFKWLPEELDI